MSATNPAVSPGDELRAHWAVLELAELGIDAVAAHDEHGRPTGLVALDGHGLAGLLEELGHGQEEDRCVNA
ncbi:hypothetical protein [Kribbella endophytica]